MGRNARSRDRAREFPTSSQKLKINLFLSFSLLRPHFGRWRGTAKAIVVCEREFRTMHRSMIVEIRDP
jgi:hypothetical protein